MNRHRELEQELLALKIEVLSFFKNLRLPSQLFVSFNNLANGERQFVTVKICIGGENSKTHYNFERFGFLKYNNINTQRITAPTRYCIETGNIYILRLRKAKNRLFRRIFNIHSQVRIQSTSTNDVCTGRVVNIVTKVRNVLRKNFGVFLDPQQKEYNLFGSGLVLHATTNLIVGIVFLLHCSLE